MNTKIKQLIDLTNLELKTELLINDPERYYLDLPIDEERFLERFAELSISQNINNSDIINSDNAELKKCVKEFFEEYLNPTEDGDDGKIFSPIRISCIRALKVKPLNLLLERMRLLSGTQKPQKVKNER